MKSKTQQEKYSPTPKIKITKWYEKVCIACQHAQKDFGDYDNVGWWECNMEKRLANLNSFPMCNAKSCSAFKPPLYSNKLHGDYWGNIMEFDKYFKDGSEALWKLIEFNKRMGDYKIGRIL